MIGELKPDRFRLLIGGELVESSDGGTTEVIDPSTEETLVAVPEATPADAERAVGAASAAFPAWRALDPRERCQRVVALAGALRAAVDDLATLESRDTGNPVTPMQTDVMMGAGVLQYFAGLAPELKGESVPMSSGGFHFTVREPFGVVARIIAFNHPLLFATGKIGAPLVAGNTVVLKLPPQAPLSCLELGRMAAEILPPGVLNVVTGNADVGRALVTDTRVRKVGLIGSAETGRQLMRDAAGHLAEVTLELGGKNPSIVFPDADVSRVAAGAVRAMNFSWQGQSCGSTSRLYVHRSIAEPLLEKLAAIVGGIRLGPPTDPATEMGPVISRQHHERILDFIAAADKLGARLLAGGGRPEGPEFERGFWVAPTVFADVTDDMRIAREEIFGPVLSVLTWDDEDDVIRRANDTEYGLTANVWTGDLDTALRVVPQLEAGYVWVNGQTQHFIGLPFGGYKQSGVGREEALEELLGHTQLKSVSMLPLSGVAP